MLDTQLRIIAPHHCYGCGKTGTCLCENCKYDIVEKAFDACIVCLRPSTVGICTSCRQSYERAWLVGDRVGTLERLINALKFERAKAAAESLTTLLDARPPTLLASTIIVPLNSHIRQRGYDHSLLIARGLGAARELPVCQLISRMTAHAQCGHNKSDRMKLASGAFECEVQLDETLIYLLVDDVVTTNATVRYAAKALRDAGAKQVWVAALARQPLEHMTPSGK